jgi:hypothetical protein
LQRPWGRTHRRILEITGEIMSNNIPILRTYLLLDCLLDSEDAESLASSKFQISDKGQEKIYVSVFYNRKGNSFTEPFVKVKIIFELYEYDLDLFEYWQNQLFIEIEENLPLIIKWKDSESVFINFMVNINSDNEQQRPIINLTTEQIKLLTDIGASFELDGYV